MSRTQAGFTLIEVVVAVAVVGAGLAVGLAAMSGSLRLLRSASEYEQAMLLARSAMTEALAYPDYELIADREREIYQGVEYGYRVEFRPVRLVSDDEARVAPPQVSLQQISVDVSWGEDRLRNYRLVSYRMALAGASAQSRLRGGATPAGEGPGAVAKEGTASGGALPRQDVRTAQ